MTGWALAALLLAQAVSTGPGTQIRTLTVSFVDDKGGEVTDLAAKDVALVENGLTRDITSFERDRRPLAVAILVDSSEATAASYRLNLVDAVRALVAGFPEGTRYAIWTTGERPTRIVDLTGDKGAAGGALRRVAPRGGNTMLDAVAEASAALARQAREGERPVLVAITGTGVELSSRDRHRAFEEAERAQVDVLALEFDDGAADLEARNNLEYVFDRLAQASGGRFEVVLSPMAVDTALRRLWAVVLGGYRLAYATVPDLEKRRLKIAVARPDTKVLIPARAQDP